MAKRPGIREGEDMKQVVVISGLAQGMGREVAKMLDAAGHSVAGFDVDAEGIESLKNELKGDHLLKVMSITDRPGILAFRDEVLAKFPRVHTVLSNVGIGFFSPFEEVDLEKALTCLDINVIGTAALLQAFVPHMRQQRGGKLICMSSLVGQVPFPFESIYSGSKFAVEGMIMSLRYELEPFGITCTIIQPAQVSTDFAAKIHVLPPESSPYFDRVRRFINRDDELIKTAPTPDQASRKIYDVILKDRPKKFYQIDFMSSVFLILNRFLPCRVRDAILLKHMDIKV